ncbi:MAG: GatB/YqeY domain-containing protein [Epsilonproteobacteria bacterium]|nr:MAG: GatB/YqeY domain-containing protein [Campylobacterota bacterium]
MSLKERLKSELKDAMRAKDILRRDTIRAINTMIKQIEVDQRVDLGDEEIIKLIQKGIKQREEAIVQFKTASRDDLVQTEQSQIDIFAQYLPKQLTDDELESIIADIIQETGATSMKDMGKVMNPTKQKVGGGADGKRINIIVKKLLA